MSWIAVQGVENAALEALVAARVGERMQAGKYAARDVAYIARLDRRPLPPEADIDASTLERLRMLCRSWDVDFITGTITSHRPVVGRFIVAGKKLLLPLVRMLLKDTLRKQRDFNAQVVEFLAQSSSRVGSSPMK